MSSGWGLAFAGGTAVLVSPVLASWSASLADGPGVVWWRPRPVSPRRWLVVTAVTVGLVLLGSAGRPWPAWWLLAAGGAVLAVVDAQTQLLPARFTHPLTAGVGGALIIGSISGGDLLSLLRAVVAAAVIGGIGLLIRFLSPPAMGLGDVRLAALTGGMLGGTGWVTLWQGQLLIMLLGGLTAIGLLITTPTRRHRRIAVPMGPAIITGSLLALWL